MTVDPKSASGWSPSTLAEMLTAFLFPSQLDEGPMGEPEGSFVDYQTTMVRTAKAIAVTVQEMVSLGGSERTDWGELQTVNSGHHVMSLLLSSPGNQVQHQP